MLKICGPAILKPLDIIFKQCIDIGVFPSQWKKGNIIPIHKKRQQTSIEKLPSSIVTLYL